MWEPRKEGAGREKERIKERSEGKKIYPNANSYRFCEEAVMSDFQVSFLNFSAFAEISARSVALNIK